MDVNNKIYSVLGRMGSGKTFLTVCFACGYERIFGNVEIKVKGRVVSQPIQSVTDLELVKFDKQKGVLIIDEAGLNVNARQSSSNMDYAKLIFLSRKKNIDIFFVSQLPRSMDVYIRELTNLRFFMSKKRFDGEARFEAVVEGQTIFGNTYYIRTIVFDLIGWARRYGIQYNTLESSTIKSGKSEKIKRMMKKGEFGFVQDTT